MKKWWTILLISIIACSSLYIIEQVLEVNYFIKTTCKIVLFLGVPILYCIFSKEKIKELFFTRSLELKDLKWGIGFGLISSSTILISFFFLQSFIDLDSISSEMKSKSISPSNFIFIALYVTFINSLIEEFFFRGFIFLKIYNTNYKKIAYISSSALFSLYHMAMFQSWFTAPMMLLCLSGLFTVGLIFNWLNTKTGSFFNSWIVHISADIAIVLIGFYMFGLI